MIKKAKFYAKEAILRAKYIMEKGCIFCKIMSGEVKTEFLYESKTVVAFADLNPVARVHILIVPRRHIDSLLTIEDSDSREVLGMFKAVAKIVKDKNLEAFRVAFNGGKFQHIGHIHMHLLAEGKIDWGKL